MRVSKRSVPAWKYRLWPESPLFTNNTRNATALHLITKFIIIITRIYNNNYYRHHWWEIVNSIHKYIFCCKLRGSFLYSIYFVYNKKVPTYTYIITYIICILIYLPNTIHSYYIINYYNFSSDHQKWYRCIVNLVRLN